MHPVLLLVALVGCLILGSWYLRAPAGKRKQIRNRALIFGGLGILALLLVTGRLHPLFAVVGALIPVAIRVMSLLQVANQARAFGNAFKSAQGPSPRQTSEVRTRFLAMTLDHDTGAMRGAVREGPYAGRELDALSLDELLDLLSTCLAEDAQSASVLEAYLDREHPDDWRDRFDGEPATRAAPTSGEMTVDEAREVLGVAPDASREDIIQAHRRLMQKMHPDRGGSTYLAVKINQAKDLLIGD